MEALEEHQISLDLSEESQEVKNKDGYHIGGLLFLSYLTKAGLQDDHLTKALTLKPEFAKLDKRDRLSESVRNSCMFTDPRFARIGSIDVPVVLCHSPTLTPLQVIESQSKT